MKKLKIVIGIMAISALLTSCMSGRNLTTEQLANRNKIDYELSQLWVDYQYKRDSLIIIFYKIK